MSAVVYLDVNGRELAGSPDGDALQLWRVFALIFWSMNVVALAQAWESLVVWADEIGDVGRRFEDAAWQQSARRP